MPTRKLPISFGIVAGRRQTSRQYESRRVLALPGFNWRSRLAARTPRKQRQATIEAFVRQERPCRRQDSNPHGLSPRRLRDVRVCHFRHAGTTRLQTMTGQKRRNARRTDE